VDRFEHPRTHNADLLSRRISQLGLKLEGSPVERFVRQLYRELERKGIARFRPVCYLTDEWGCPSGEPVIGIPFYLADPELANLEKAMNDLEDEREIMRYLRHEAGHAFNYAYQLYKTPEWRRLFGPWNRPYRDHYRPIPFSRKFVRHLAGWYGQKHPDEDFAETFAVWLTPRSNWREKYATWPAIHKLKYVDAVARQVKDVDPPVPSGDFDITVSDMRLTVEQFYRRVMRQNERAPKLVLDSELKEIFLPKNRLRKHKRAAADVITENRLALIDNISDWTGVRRPLIKTLVEAMADASRRLELEADPRRIPEYLIEMTAFGTTLAMNYMNRGRFEIR
jgi:hypothetical protein